MIYTVELCYKSLNINCNRLVDDPSIPYTGKFYVLQNFCEFREFWQIAKFSFAKFHNVGVACRANKRDREMALYFNP